jgi:DNA-binding LytR/AlgR family response regulator
MTNCLIISKDTETTKKLSDYVHKIPNLELTGQTADYKTAQFMIREQEVKLVFLDLNGEEENIDFITSAKARCGLIVISSIPSDAIKAFEIQAIDFLYNPVNFIRFSRAVDKAMPVVSGFGKNNNMASGFIILKADPKLLVKIEVDDIEYVEGKGNYSAIRVACKEFLSLVRLKAIDEKLPKDKFIRIHKSFIVSIRKIAFIGSSYIILKDSQRKIPIGKTYKILFSSRIQSSFIL